MLTGLTIAADPDRWVAAGFAVDDAQCLVGEVELRFTSAEGESGIRSWSLTDVGEPLDGLAVDPATAAQADRAAEHPNGAIAIDHVVAFTPTLERTSAAFESAGIRCRRVREYGEGDDLVRQGFFRVGQAIAEVVETPQLRAGDTDAPAAFWGITFTVADLDASAEFLGVNFGSIRDAVQPGRRIATIRREAELGLPVALMTPVPPRPE